MVRAGTPRPGGAAGPVLLPPGDFEALTGALSRNGFRGPCSWYLNDEANIAYAAEAPDGGRLSQPALLVHATWDTTCDTVHSRLADPMRAACAHLTETTVDAGHALMLERPAEVNAALDDWLDGRRRDPPRSTPCGGGPSHDRPSHDWPSGASGSS
jgi:pimeloyl-ACP methyl ester carboxylesterase